eukprot:GHVT01081101.1.p1 GENE.GHVT01081101.1~~GHVT01081101.1.p1  ORF type:complete len:337 (+),score=30.40 GHVT01081101.1:3869-4879(+)
MSSSSSLASCRGFQPGHPSTWSAARLPRLLYGTAWKKERTCQWVQTAIQLGYRAFDTAAQPKHYDEEAVGQALHKSITATPSTNTSSSSSSDDRAYHALGQGSSSLNKNSSTCSSRKMPKTTDRGSFFIQTKFTPIGGQDASRPIPYDASATLETQVEQSASVSLANLRVEYLDSLLLHSPMESIEDTLIVWKAFEGLVHRKLVRFIGICNCYDVHTLRTLHKRATIKPAIVQNRFYPQTRYDRELRLFCDSADINYQSFWTLTGNPHVLQSPAVLEMSQMLDRTPAQLLFQYCIQKNISPLTGTCNREHAIQDLLVLEQPDLSDEDLLKIQSTLL